MEIIVFLVLLAGGYFIGTHLEKQHLASIRAREQRLVGLVAVTMKTLPESDHSERVGLVAGSVVVSVDYFKRFLATLRMIFGGRLSAYETVIDRGRREALLRMKEAAVRQGYDAIINVRLETSRLASSYQNGKGTAGVEVVAFGTGIKLPAGSQFAGRAPQALAAG